MQGADLSVRHVRGRYGRGVLRSENVVTTVTEVAHVYRIRIDDEANDDAWIEITVEADVTEAVPCGHRHGTT